MSTLLFLCVCAASVPLLGGRLDRLGDLRLRWVWAIGLALAVQVAFISLFPHADPLGARLAHVSSYLLAGAFVWENRHVPGLLLVGAGGGLNAFVIAINGGVMPASPAAQRLAGMDPEAADGFANSTVVADPHLQFLGDAFAIPGVNVISPGDVLIAAGLLYGIHRLCGSRLPRAGRALLVIPSRKGSS